MYVEVKTTLYGRLSYSYRKLQQIKSLTQYYIWVIEENSLS